MARGTPISVCNFDDEGGEPGAELHRGCPEGVGGLEAMTPLHASAALRAAADLDVEAAHDGADPGEFFLVLGVHAGHFDGAAAVGTRRRGRRSVGLVDSRRAASGPLPAVLRPGPSAGLAGPLRPFLGEGCSLPFGGAAGLIELFLEVFAASLPAVSIAGGTVQVAGGAVQIVDQLGVLPLKLLDALGHAPRIGTCPPKLHTTSRIFSTLPANQRPRIYAGLGRAFAPPAPCRPCRMGDSHASRSAGSPSAGASRSTGEDGDLTNGARLARSGKQGPSWGRLGWMPVAR